jgi:hypothetical protein
MGFIQDLFVQFEAFQLCYFLSDLSRLLITHCSKSKLKIIPPTQDMLYVKGSHFQLRKT